MSEHAEVTRARLNLKFAISDLKQAARDVNSRHMPPEEKAERITRARERKAQAMDRLRAALDEYGEDDAA